MRVLKLLQFLLCFCVIIIQYIMQYIIRYIIQYIIQNLENVDIYMKIIIIVLVLYSIQSSNLLGKKVIWL